MFCCGAVTSGRRGPAGPVPNISLNTRSNASIWFGPDTIVASAHACSCPIVVARITVERAGQPLAAVRAGGQPGGPQRGRECRRECRVVRRARSRPPCAVAPGRAVEAGQVVSHA